MADGVVGKKLGDTGPIASREKLTRRAAYVIGRRTRLDPERIALLLGSQMFLSKGRQTFQMLRRLRS
jgi:hypothetical protein